MDGFLDFRVGKAVECLPLDATYSAAFAQAGVDGRFPGITVYLHAFLIFDEYGKRVDGQFPGIPSGNSQGVSPARRDLLRRVRPGMLYIKLTD